MKCIYRISLALLAANSLWSQEVGQGAPAAVEQSFIRAFYRNNFNALVSTPALANVRSFGTTGYVQEFADAKGNNSKKFALVKANALSTAENDVRQMFPLIYGYYTSVGVATAGFPTSDTGGCPYVSEDGLLCGYQVFDKGYALFAYGTSLGGPASGGEFTVRPPFYARWVTAGGITGIGPARSAETTITSVSTGITAVSQFFVAGALYSITSGAATGKVYAVAGKVYELYTVLGANGGSLGLPTSDELNAGSGRFRQNFEGGSIEYTASTGPIVRPAVGQVVLSISTSSVTRLNIGDSLPIRATVLATVGGELTDRDVSWITSNGRVVSIQSTGSSATLRAVGGGTANIQAVSDGKLSTVLTVFVAAPCCQIGEGAPNTAIQQSFQDAVTRNRLSIKLPAANPVRRSALGYVQELESADGSQSYLLCRSDRSPGVFVVTGDHLRAYAAEGGPVGRLAYPTSDVTPSGRQNFEGGALAGLPIQAVMGRILALWASLNYEAGSLGAPIGAALSGQSFTGSLGAGQPFANGFVYVIETGASAGKALVVAGPILARYGSVGAIAGRLGFPVTDEYNENGRRRQDFEGGSLLYSPGDAEAELQESDRKPSVTTTPNRVAAGGKVRIAVGGFSAGGTVRVSFAGPVTLTPFNVTTDSGSYTWEIPIPNNSRTGVMTVTAAEVSANTQATGTFTVTALAEANLQLTKVRGDTQTGLPGAQLLNPLVISLKDELGTPVAGVAVRFSQSPGSSIISASAVTDERGEASATLRLQGSDGIALVAVDAAGRVATFSARASGSSLTNFPKQTQAGTFTLGSSSATVAQKGALLAAVSSVIRYFQSRSEVPTSLGLSEPASLNDFLKNYCVLDTQGSRICDGYLTPSGPSEPIVNLWRLKEFGGNSVDVEVYSSDEVAVRDMLANGMPVILVLTMQIGDAAVGSHFVVATGVAADGSLLIHDPNPLFNRTRLSDYYTGIQVAGRTWTATISGAIRLIPRSSSPTGFLLTSGNSPIAVRSQSGECGMELRLSPTVVADGPQPTPGGTSYIYYCSGQQVDYAASFGAAGAFQAQLTDLGSPGRREEISRGSADSTAVVRVNAQWQLARLETRISTNNIVNAATLTSDIAPGSLLAVFGSGLAKAGTASTAEIGGRSAVVQTSQEFRLNVEIPPDTPPGRQMLTISTPFGAVDVALDLAPVAPAIFQDEVTKRPLIVNAGGVRNSATDPVNRGGVITIYATGLGSVVAQGSNRVAATPVSVVVGGTEVAASFAGLAAGLPGVYVVNVAVPAGLPPGLAIPLLIRQGGAESNAVQVAVR